ncbi:MAG: sulfatase [Sedimentisphaeraceae bacterium JB056]
MTSRRSFLKMAGASAAAAMLGGCRSLDLHDDKNKKPNIIFILTDDQGWADLSIPFDPQFPEACCKAFKTPNMNKFSKSALRFTDAYAPAPICTPTRRSIQFGMTPARQKAPEFQGAFDPSGKWSIAQAIKQADPSYKCAHFGKWGGVITGTWKDRQSQLPGSPSHLGYDESDGMEGVNEGGFYLREWDVGRWNINLECEPFADPKRTFSMTDKSIDFMRRQTKQGNPFYLQVSYHAIHLASRATQETIDEYKDAPQPDRKVIKSIAPMIDELDENVGRLLDEVEKLGIDYNTYIFFTSDNGGEHWEIWYQNAPEKNRNHPLRMHKQNLYEGGIRVPFAVKGPGVEKGGLCRVPVAGYDLLPTFYEITGGIKQIPQKLDGISLCPLLAGDFTDEFKRPNDGLVFHRPKPARDTVEGQSAYRQGNYKLMLFWTREGDLKRTELYDLSKDIGEENDLSEKMPQKTAELKKILLDYLESVK